MALPTKKDLLATGLEPIEHEDCAICKDPMEDPVRVPCNGKHAFCKACITTWLKQSNTTTCPSCRQVLCSVPADDEVVRVPPPPANNRVIRDPQRFASVAQRIRVRDAFSTSGLGRFVFHDEREHTDTPIPELIIFGDEIRWSYPLLSSLSHDARTMLTSPLNSQHEGALFVDAEALGCCLTLMGNIIMRTAANDNREYNDATKEAWDKTILAIWRLIAPHHGTRLDSKAMFRAILLAVYDSTIQLMCPFLCNGYLADDLLFLVYFTLTHAGQWMPRATVQAEVEAGRIDQPLALPRTRDVEELPRWEDEITARAFAHPE